MQTAKQMDRLIDGEELLRLVPYSIQQIRRKEKDGSFPKRIRIGGNRVAWLQSEVTAWLEERLAERAAETS